MRRFFIAPERLASTAPYIEGQEARHLSHVLRLGCGAKIEIFDGQGGVYLATVTRIAPNRVDLKIGAKVHQAAESPLKITIAQALLKARKMDVLIRQLTELGIHALTPFLAQRSVPAPGDQKQAHQISRWEKIAIEAVKQCRRDRPPHISNLTRYDDLLALSADFDLCLIFWENQSGSLHDILTAHRIPAPQKILLAIGPEGGFSKTEVDKAQAAGFVTAPLGPRILRAETAAVAATALVQHHLGDLK